MSKIRNLFKARWMSSLIFLLLLFLITGIADPAFLNASISPFGIAVTHSVFNLLSTCTLAPFGKQLAALATRLERWFRRYQQMWREVSRESELWRIREVCTWYANELR